MKIIYRACSVGNPNKNRPIKDRVKLVQICFASFLDAFSTVDYDLTILLDKPTNEYRDVFEGFEVEESYYSNFNEGNIKSFHRQIDIALEAYDDFMFCEDDYYWLPSAGQTIEKAIKELPLITPYLHPAYFAEGQFDYKKTVKLVGDHVWMETMSTTLTFAGQRDVLRSESKVMKSYGWADHPMFCDITKRVPLYTPIPSLATHMEVEWLAPTVNWRDFF